MHIAKSSSYGLPQMSGVRNQQKSGFKTDTLRQQPLLQPKFSGVDLEKYFKLMLKLSATFWGGLAVAGVGYPVAHNLKNKPEVTHMSRMEQQKASSEAKVLASLKLLQNTPPADRAKALEAHQQLVQQEVLNQLEVIKTGVDATSVFPAVKNALAESKLSAEEQNEVAKLFVSNENGDFISPQEAFNQFADKILSKHTNAETVEQAKQSMRNILTHDSGDRLLGNLALGVAILGSLAAAGMLGFAALSGTNGLFMVVAWAPMVGLGVLAEGVRQLRGKKK
jgi:hypothetical protein